MATVSAGVALPRRAVLGCNANHPYCWLIPSHPNTPQSTPSTRTPSAGRHTDTGSADTHPGGGISCGPHRGAAAQRSIPAPACPGGIPAAGGRTAGSPVVTACCAAAVTQGQVSDGGTSSTEPLLPVGCWAQGLRPAGTEQGPSPVPVPSPSPCSPAAAPAPRRSGRCHCRQWPGCGGTGGRRARMHRCNTPRRSRGSCCCGRMGVSGSQHLSSACLIPSHCTAPTIGASLQTLTPVQGTHPSAGHPPRAGAPLGSQTHKELQQLKSAS